MLQPNTHFLFAESLALYQLSILFCCERLLLSITLSLWSNNACVTRARVSPVCPVPSLQISVFGVRSRPSVSVCWAQAAAQCTLITLGLSYRKLVAALSFSQSWVTLYSSQVMSPTACFTWPVTAFPPIRLDNTDTDHGPGHMMSWPESHLETEDGESSVGDRGECTLVHWRLHCTADCTM